MVKVKLSFLTALTQETTLLIAVEFEDAEETAERKEGTL